MGRDAFDAIVEHQVWNSQIGKINKFRGLAKYLLSSHYDYIWVLIGVLSNFQVPIKDTS